MNSNLSVDVVSYDQAREWILQRHYAHRMPSVSYVFGLFKNKELVALCTYGQIPNYREDEAWKPFRVLEFNRLIAEDELPRNSMSFLIGKSFKMLPRPIVLISYADYDQGHIGYVYQATNWIYTGIGGEGCNIYVMKDGSEKHKRHEKALNMDDCKEIKKTSGKARYYYFLGSKKERKRMVAMLRFPVLPYPKGESKRYDTNKPLVKKGLLY